MKWVLVRLNYQIKTGRSLEVRRLGYDHTQLVRSSQNLDGPTTSQLPPQTVKFLECLNAVVIQQHGG